MFLETRVGYTGGDAPDATYGNHDGHAEATRLCLHWRSGWSIVEQSGRNQWQPDQVQSAR